MRGIRKRRLRIELSTLLQATPIGGMDVVRNKVCMERLKGALMQHIGYTTRTGLISIFFLSVSLNYIVRQCTFLYSDTLGWVFYTV